jgi:hypothetical protein
MNLKFTVLVFWSGAFVFCGWKFTFCNGLLGTVLMVHLSTFSPVLFVVVIPHNLVLSFNCYNE